MSDDVWSERDTNPDAIDAALRDLLRKRHAANRALAPARVLNLIVVIDRAQSGALKEQLGHLGRHSSSRTILCAVEDRRRTLDVTAVMSYQEPPTGGFGLIHERVEIDIGPKHLRRLKTIVDPVLIPELPTALWCPQHERAIDTLRGSVDAVVLDSDRAPEPAAALARAAELARSTYVVDMAWIRTTPWRERLAAAFDPPARLAALQSVTAVSIRHRTDFSASGMLLAGWLASRLQWKTSPLVPDNRAGLRGTARTNSSGSVEIAIDPVTQRGSGVAGLTVSSDGGFSLSLDEAAGGVRVREHSAGSGEAAWQALESPPGERGTLAEAVRQAMLRDPTYRPALDAARHLSESVGVEPQALNQPARGCASTSFGRVSLP
jgi:glucose-6-phosphate dehydrogenase assembly protein OpcA